MPTYFQILPEEVHDEIARVFFRDLDRDDTDDVHSIRDTENLEILLRYAKLSEPQRCAVMRVMNNKIAPFLWRKQTFWEWLVTCGDLIFELDLLKSKRILFPGGFPRLPNLRCASVHARFEHLLAISKCSRVSKLTVKIEDFNDWGFLLTAIHGLPMKEMNLEFELCPRLWDIRENLHDFPSPRMHRKMIAACPLVESFTVRGRINNISSPIWTVIKALPSLKKLGYQGEIKHENVSFLETMSEVVLYGARNIFQLQWARITALLQINDLDKYRVEKLGNFSFLRRLSIIPNKWAEKALIGVIRNVEELAISWRFEKLRYVGHGAEGWGFCRCRFFSDYHKPNPDVLSAIIGSAPHLISLKLENCVVDAGTVERILKVVGQRLEILEIAIDWQPEFTTDRLSSILRAVAKLCTRLRTLKLLEDGDRYLPIFATNEGTADCLRALEEVKRVLPGFLSDGNIRELIQNRFENREAAHLLIWDDIVRDL